LWAGGNRELGKVSQSMTRLWAGWLTKCGVIAGRGHRFISSPKRNVRSWDSTVSIVTCHKLDDWQIVVWLLAGATGLFPLLSGMWGVGIAQSV
jgi:hypothetical protein